MIVISYKSRDNILKYKTINEGVAYDSEKDEIVEAKLSGTIFEYPKKTNQRSEQITISGGAVYIYNFENRSYTQFITATESIITFTNYLYILDSTRGY